MNVIFSKRLPGTGLEEVWDVGSRKKKKIKNSITHPRYFLFHSDIPFITFVTVYSFYCRVFLYHPAIAYLLSGLLRATILLWVIFFLFIILVAYPYPVKISCTFSSRCSVVGRRAYPALSSSPSFSLLLSPPPPRASSLPPPPRASPLPPPFIVSQHRNVPLTPTKPQVTPKVAAAPMFWVPLGTHLPLLDCLTRRHFARLPHWLTPSGWGLIFHGR